MSDFLFRGTLAELDPELYRLNQIEAERQYRKLILIASESTVPLAVREALDSPFNNVYAEGYPDEASRRMTESQILDYETQLLHYRRLSDPRYYKGVEYCDTVEALARRRCAELFANDKVKANGLYVNVQALSGGPANNAVYQALINIGDTVMGLDLMHGGHLSHGAKVNRSGKWFNSVPYSINPTTEKLDYDQIRNLARQHKPKLIIAGYSSYPFPPDWQAFRSIADEVGAFLLADIAHVASLVACGEYPSPVGIADVVTFTTHKSLNGARGAVIMTHRADLSSKIDRAVFPGEQGGPHINTILALAVAFKINQSEQFRLLQKNIKANAVAMVEQFQKHGFKVPFGGTASHLINVDCRSVVGPDGTELKGDIASRILDVAGIVVNRNTIPGDTSALNPSGLRLGTGWISQRGFTTDDSRQLADLMSTLLKTCQPVLVRASSTLYRARIDFDTFNDVKNAVRDLAQSKGIDFEPIDSGYPHFYYSDEPAPSTPFVSLPILGENAPAFVQSVCNGVTVSELHEGDGVAVKLTVGSRQDSPVVAGVLSRAQSGFALAVPGAQSTRVKTWLRDLSDGYVQFLANDLYAKPAGPVTVRDGQPLQTLPATAKASRASQGENLATTDLPHFRWTEPAPSTALLKTPLYDVHKASGARMVGFAGYDMPVWYTSVVEEHAATRKSAGLFDVSHMGVWDLRGTSAADFLDELVANDIRGLAVGQSAYTHLLDPQANVLDDLIVYRLASDHILIVVNASNNDKDWAWVNAVLAGKVQVSASNARRQLNSRDGLTLRDLRAEASGADRRINLAIQGPTSQKVLVALGGTAETLARLKAMGRFGVGKFTLGENDLLIARTGYTGESVAYEVFVHPDQAVTLWQKLVQAGAVPVGLGARDSLRTEAGLPLYGHELAGPLNLGVSEAGLQVFVKPAKNWFIGRSAYLARQAKQTGKLIRFRFNNKGVRMAHLGDPVVNEQGRVVGHVSSCAIDSDGFLSGMAYVEETTAKKGTLLGIFSGASDKAEKALATLKTGNRVRLADWATVQGKWKKAS
ncbi:MAG TPA: glycine cleavage system aminomethyltransferase GcvT [Anaerolineales bacterium]|nr:glycine cleavage system aminomethyltransferase GcvT [Anaerolineales bacterium]